ncbi:dihydrodipicolinate synthase family protein [Amycolatopsis sp. 195334CR]|uniref:dihydrodipicolinate synthase family protein n=1 Tax=Amycolatopsis sp. 195334CR TaxID=2814588 RepID=UPI001A8FC5F1|nr:dihydrodipicolinate synthase family protein [Amycolatopsis sp. 195334CR]MBN6039565.1 dihydrodipicolinate synthase family protein [Amycolatopsis sp. 195334CR]
MFTGLSAFPLTPITDDGIDEAGYERLVGRLADAGVDSIGALGSTGSYPYLNRKERALAARLAVKSAGPVPVIIGVGALRTRDVLACVEDAQEAGAAGVLLPAMTYQALTDDEVFGLYEEVTASLSVPLVVYDNPGTTHVTFSDELHGRIAHLPNVASIKIPGVSTDPAEARARIDALRAVVPETVTIGVSGDALAAGGLAAGADAWYSVLGGLFPKTCLTILRDGSRSADLAPLWTLFARYGSYRVVSAIAVELGLLASPNLPRPVRPLDETGRQEVVTALNSLTARD